MKKTTVKQEVIVRWLSMSQLLENILCSYSTLTSIASEKGTLHTLPSIDVTSTAAIVSLFAPWKRVIERIQSTNTPSLHLVVTSYWYLLESMTVSKEEKSDKAAQGKSFGRKESKNNMVFLGIVFFKVRARQLLKAMFVIHDLHWIAAVLNPRTRMLKMATEGERCYAHGLICSRIAQIMETNRINTSPLMESVENGIRSSPPHKKFKSYTAQFDDDININQSNTETTNAMRARRELDAYLQFDLSKSTHSLEDADDPLAFWRKNELILPNLSKLSKKIFNIPASSAAVERSFSSAGYIISQRRTNLNPSTVNDMILVRSAATHWKNAV